MERGVMGMGMALVPKEKATDMAKDITRILIEE